MKRIALVVTLLLIGWSLLVAWPVARAAELTVPDARAAMQKGNYKDAYDNLSRRVISAEGTDQLSSDFMLCLSALQALGRIEEADDFREKAIAAHPAMVFAFTSPPTGARVSIPSLRHSNCRR